MPRPSAEKADLIDALQAYIGAAVGGDRSSDEPPPRDTPGSRAARAAAPDDSNTGQRRTPPGRSRLDSLPAEEQAAVQGAAALLKLLQRISTPQGLSPGEESALVGNGRAWGARALAPSSRGRG